MKNPKDRKTKYHLLREAGFTSFEAQRLQDYSWEKVNYFVEMNSKYKHWLQNEMNKRGRKHGNKQD